MSHENNQANIKKLVTNITVCSANYFQPIRSTKSLSQTQFFYRIKQIVGLTPQKSDEPQMDDQTTHKAWWEQINHNKEAGKYCSVWYEKFKVISPVRNGLISDKLQYTDVKMTFSVHP